MNALETLEAYAIGRNIRLSDAVNELRYQLDSSCRKGPRYSEHRLAAYGVFGAFYDPAIHGPYPAPAHVVEETPTSIVPAAECVRVPCVDGNRPAPVTVSLDAIGFNCASPTEVEDRRRLVGNHAEEGR